jgi:hypothetical protein
LEPTFAYREHKLVRKKALQFYYHILTTQNTSGSRHVGHFHTQVISQLCSGHQLGVL